MDDKPKVDEKWTSSNFEKFLITRVVVIDEETWIYYEKLSDGSRYNCLQESFLARFHKIENENK